MAVLGGFVLLHRVGRRGGDAQTGAQNEALRAIVHLLLLAFFLDARRMVAKSPVETNR